MNSGNHVMLVGDLLTWFYEYLAGIRPTAERPGFHRIEIKPYVLGDLTEVRASVETPYGIAASHWVRSGDALTLEVVIPTNCTARIGVPSLGNDTPTITEGGQTVWRDGAACGDVRGIASAQAQDEWIFFETGSGNYRFQVSP
jgi:alpha-L-rhamnosidase